MTNAQGKQETGGSLIFIGLAVWVADLLVFFFLPAGVRLGSQRTFAAIIAILAVAGLVLIVKGYQARGKRADD